MLCKALTLITKATAQTRQALSLYSLLDALGTPPALCRPHHCRRHLPDNRSTQQHISRTEALGDTHQLLGQQSRLRQASLPRSAHRPRNARCLLGPWAKSRPLRPSADGAQHLEERTLAQQAPAACQGAAAAQATGRRCVGRPRKVAGDCGYCCVMQACLRGHQSIRVTSAIT